MKVKLLFLFLLLNSWIGLTQITAGQVDDFQNGTVQGWIIGNGNPSGFGTSVVSDAGPEGIGDNALDYSSTGGGGLGSRMVVYNESLTWQGNYLDQNIQAIKFDIKAEINDLNIKIAFQRGTNDNFTRIATLNPIVIAAGSGWTSIEIPLTLSNFEIVDNFQGDYTITEVLQDVSVMRILSSTSSLWLGESIAANMRLDNITASTTLSTHKLNIHTEFEISPNPASSYLNIKLSNDMKHSNLEVYDVLGKKIYSKTLDALISSINVSNWNKGIYLIKLSTNSKAVTKRFVKQ